MLQGKHALLNKRLGKNPTNLRKHQTQLKRLVKRHTKLPTKSWQVYAKFVSMLLNKFVLIFFIGYWVCHYMFQHY